MANKSLQIVFLSDKIKFRSAPRHKNIFIFLKKVVTFLLRPGLIIMKPDLLSEHYQTG